MNLQKNAVLFFATGCFVGKIPVAPGTFGTFLGLPICFLLAELDAWVAVIFAILFILFSMFIAEKAQNILNQKDPGCIVIDEIAGIMVALFGLPPHLFFAIFGFIIFRILDILKPGPIGYLDRKMSGGTGVVADDVAAGVMTNVILRLVWLIQGGT